METDLCHLGLEVVKTIIMKMFKDILAPMYLGFAISQFADLHWFNWQFYAIIVPFFILAKITKFNQKED